MGFIHLRSHSYFSFLRGLPSPDELAKKAAGMGMPVLGLTDHHSLSGAVEFVDACREAGVRPIIGLEVELTPPADMSISQPGCLVLLAMDMAGWRSLCRISSSLAGDEDALPFNKLADEAQGLLCLTGGKRGLLASLVSAGQRQSAEGWVSRLNQLFNQQLYIELQNHTPQDLELCEKLANLANRMHLPIVATQDIHYLSNEQAHLQKVVSAIRMIRPLNELDADSIAPAQAEFASPQDMAERMANFSSALEATQEIAERCHLELPLGALHFPELLILDGMSGAELLRQKAEAGANKLYGQMLPETQARLNRELAVINEYGFTSLFLIMEEILNFARREGIPFSSRGSAASSLVAHCLGITSPDPLRLNLYFERFLNPARATPPDIDTDLCSRRREEVIRFVYRRFGEDQVATVCTINRFRNRSALREVAKAYGLPPDQVSALADSLPYRWYGPPNRRAGHEDPFAELAERYRTPTHQLIFRDSAALIGIPHHLSVHPGGVVISPGPLTDMAPTQVANKGVIITQFDLDSIERLGLVKIDLLGIRGLTVLGDVVEIIAREKPPIASHPGSSILTEILETIPSEDAEVSQNVSQGKTIGCFQIESPGMRATLKEIKARSIDDIMVALSLYRPGPLTGGLKDAFVRRHLGQEVTEHLHPALSTLLADTYGVVLYQEQVLRIAHELAGFSLADADLLRRAMSHFDPGKQMQTLKDKFVAGAWELNQVPEDIASRVWELIAAFSGYGFPKAHAASYAQVSWRSAWCKTHYPAFFMAAVLANWGGYYSQRIYMNEARRMGLKLRPPEVNHAEREFSVKILAGEPVLFMGLDQVKELTQRTQAQIVQQRPFSTFTDFLARVNPRAVEVENLVKSGSVEGFGTIPTLLQQLKQGGWQAGQLSLFGMGDGEQEDWSLEQKVTAQEELLGTGVIAHPLELVKDKISAANALNTVEAAAQLEQHVRVAGMRQIWRRSITTRGDYIYFMSLEDLEGMLDVVITSDVYRRSKTALSTAGPYVVEGRMVLDSQKGEPSIRAERIWSLK
ncbi:MAG TPA: DNA polymerase III subunit alpha [Anaerolineales bacterium]|nr:DNA polymerase III subunit alpha [Anaerolineales bacterium]